VPFQWIWNYPAGKGQRTEVDHAVVVTEVPMAAFAQVWSTGENLLIVTRQTGR
jgi:hypothetical protein